MRKWVRDEDSAGERSAAWFLQDHDSRFATVCPMWSASRAHGIGKPDSYQAVYLDRFVGSFRTIREATKAVDAFRKPCPVCADEFCQTKSSGCGR